MYGKEAEVNIKMIASVAQEIEQLSFKVNGVHI